VEVEIEEVGAEVVTVEVGEADGVEVHLEEEVEVTVAEEEAGVVDVVAEEVPGVELEQLLLNLIDMEECLLQEEKKMPL
jgi:hypothetical protein